MRVTPDDEIYRVNTVWLGPRGLTFPWTARYLAYATWLVSFLAILLVEALTPLTVGIPPIWEICLATLFTYGVMGFVDHERPVGAVWRTFLSDLNAPRPAAGQTTVRTRVRVRVRPGLRPDAEVGRRRPRLAVRRPRIPAPARTPRRRPGATESPAAALHEFWTTSPSGPPAAAGRVTTAPALPADD